LQLERTNNNKNGPIFIVSIGETYYLDKENQLRHKSGEEVKLARFEFETILIEFPFDSKKTIEKTLSKDREKMQKKFIDFFKPMTLETRNQNITFINSSKKEKIQVRIKNDEQDFKEIEYHIVNKDSSVSLDCKFGNNTLEVLLEKNDEKILKSFSVQSKYCYNYKKGKLQDMNNEKKIIFSIEDKPKKIISKKQSILSTLSKKSIKLFEELVSQSIILKILYNF